MDKKTTHKSQNHLGLLSWTLELSAVPLIHFARSGHRNQVYDALREHAPEVMATLMGAPETPTEPVICKNFAEIARLTLTEICELLSGPLEGKLELLGEEEFDSLLTTAIGLVLIVGGLRHDPSRVVMRAARRVTEPHSKLFDLLATIGKDELGAVMSRLNHLGSDTVALALRALKEVS